MVWYPRRWDYRILSDAVLDIIDGPGADQLAWRAVCAWCEKHGMDPNLMPATQRIVRNVEACRVEYDEFQVDEHGLPVLSAIETELSVFRTFAQGKTPPMPWPEELRIRSRS